MRPGGPQGSWWMKERQRAVGLKLGCWVPAFLRALGGEATDGLESVPWAKKISRAAEQLNLCTTTTESVLYSLGAVTTKPTCHNC